MKRVGRFVLPLLLASLVLLAALGQGWQAPSAWVMAAAQAMGLKAPVAEAQPVATAVTTPPAGQGAEIAVVEAATAQLRQLSPQAEVATAFVNQGELRQLMVDLLDRDYLPSERERDQRVLVLLGLIDPSRDLVQAWLDLYESEVVGLYDSDTKTLYVVADQPTLSPAVRVTLSHEYVHALQDQYYDLNALQPKHSDNQDRLLAVDALIEGDATLTMSLYAVQALTREELAQLGASNDPGGLQEAPLIMQIELLFPYTEGLQFVRRLHSRGGFASIDQAYWDPPRSTEQVLHPDKYDRREPPVEVVLPDLSQAAGEGWQKHSENTLGELYLRTLIEQYGDNRTASAAASGWGGDRWQLLTRQDQSLLALRTVWDSERDADEFFTAYVGGLSRRFGESARIEGSFDHVTVTAPGYWVSLRWHGRTVDAVIAPDLAAGAPVSAELARSE